MINLTSLELNLDRNNITDEGFDTLSAKMAHGLWYKVHGEFKRSLETLEETKMSNGTMLNGRQLYWMILQEIERPGPESQVNALEDLLELQLQSKHA